MPFAREGYDPETIELLQECLDMAWATAIREIPSLKASQAQKEHTRTVLASALLEASNVGETDRVQLIEFALRALPAFRRSHPESLAG